MQSQSQMSQMFSTNLDPYVLIITFVLGAASAFFYIRSLPDSDWHKYRQVYNEHQKLRQREANMNNNNNNNESNNETNTDNHNNNGNDTNDNDRNAGSTETGSKTEDVDAVKNGESKSDQKTVRIYVDGCWDLCHSGHYNAIRQAKALGDHLVVGVHSCEEIARNKRWPVMNDKERLACVESCKWVDQVVFDVPYSPSLELIDRSDIAADYVAHGDDIAINANGKSAYEEVETRLKIFKRTPGVSTTNLINRLVNAIKYEQSIENNKEDTKNKNTNKSKTNDTDTENTNENSNNNNNNNKDTDNDANKPQKAKKGDAGSWSQFLSSSHRIAAFSNGKTPSKTDKVVYIDGVFDLFHAGHIAAIKEAKKQGTFLYVGLFDDTLIRSKKGPYFPLMNIQERTLNVLSCKFVDEVIIGCPWNIGKDMLSVLNIENVVTTHITNELCDDNDERYDYVKSMNKFLSVNPKDSQLTTKELMGRIVNDQERIEKENAARVAKEMAYLKNRQYVEEG